MPKYPDAQETIARHMAEGDLQASVEDRCRLYGWTYYHTRDSRDSVEGFPDLVAARDGVMLYAELKTAIGKLLAEQIVWLDALAQASHRVAQIERMSIRDALDWNFITRVFVTMAAARRHTFQVLTKRPKNAHAFLTDSVIVERIRAVCEAAPVDVAWRWPLPNLWLGVSAENQRMLDERVPVLLQTPASVRFISAEPLLGPLDLRGRRADERHLCTRCGERPDAPHDHPDGYRRRGLDWIIVGGESGPGARPMDLAWARSIRDQCAAAGVAFFMKQLGGPRIGNLLAELPEDLRVREFPV